MKNKIFWSTCLALCSIGNNLFSQATNDISSINIIQKAIELHDNKKYDEAIAEYKKVNRSDSNYVYAATELVTTYIASGKDSSALVLANDLLEIPSSFVPQLISLKASALDDLKQSEAAINVYEEGIKRFPLNYSYTYELGILKMRQEKYKEAYDWFVKSLKVNPYHANTHYHLGLIEMKQGKLAQTMMALLFSLIIDNSSDKAKDIVYALEKMANNEFDFESSVSVPGLDGQDDFSEIETLLKSKVALSKKYKSETKLKFNLTKQVQLIAEKIQVTENDKGFFMQFYAPFFSQLYSKKMLEPFSYYILGGMGIKDVDSWAKSNKDKIAAFEKWAADYISDNISYYEENLNGKMTKVRHYYSKANTILAIGNLDSKGQPIGYWVYYYPNGIKKSEGAHNDKNNRHGVWKYYDKGGVIEATENYEDGKNEGQVEMFYMNGSIDTRKNFVKNLMEGDQLVYYPTGVMKNSYAYTGGVQNGKEKQFHPNGKLEYEVNVVNGKYEGELIQYYMSGHIHLEIAYKGGKQTGTYKRYYNYPENVVSEEGSYNQGLIDGPYMEYHKNGKVSVSGEFKNGEKHSNWKTYNDEGVLLSEETFNNGKYAGTTKNYSNKGVLEEECIYKNDMLQEYKAYGPDGKIIYQNQKDGKSNYDVKLYYANGNLKREGAVKNGKLDGKWKNYHEDGFLVSQENYLSEKNEGVFYYYYPGGKVESEEEYANDSRNGHYKHFYKNGKLQREGFYLDGQMEGVWKSYYVDGTLESINFYKNGSLFNLQQYYAANGKLDYEEVFELDYVKERIDYDSLGNRTFVCRLDKGTGGMEIKYMNGKVHYKQNYQN